MDESSRLRSIALNRERERASRIFADLIDCSHAELRDNVFPCHVRAVNVMRAEDGDAVKSGTAGVYCHKLGGDFRSAIRVTRVQDVWNDEWHLLVGWDNGRSLVG